MKTIFATALYVMLFAATSLAGNPNEDLITACRQANQAQASKALAAGADANAKDTDGKSALTNAVFSPAIVRLLLDKGADPNGGNYPAVIQAANNYCVESLEMLLAAGANPNLPGIVKSPQLEALYKSIRDLEALLANTKGKPREQLETTIASMKAQYGDPDAGTGMQVYALNLTVQATNCVPCMEKLLAAGAKTDLVPDQPLIQHYATFAMSQANRKAAFAKGKASMEGFGLKVPDWYANLPENHNRPTAEVLQLLLKAGGNINQADANGKTPIHLALAGGVGNKQEVLLALINQGADITVEDPVFGKCFTLAAKTGLVPVAEAMLNKGADMEETSKIFDEKLGQSLRGVTPLIAATMHGHLPMVKFLVSKGAKIKEDAEGFSYNMYTGCATGVRNKSAIYFAIDIQNSEMLHYFVDESGLKWNRKIVINQLKQSSTSQFGNLQITTTKCFNDGSYSPSEYAKKLDDKKTAAYLKGKGL